MTMKRTIWWADPEKMSEDSEGPTTPMEPAGRGQGNLVGSKLENGMHAPTIDIDFPCFVVPSSTPGHFHLYIDKEMTWRDYTKLLTTMHEVGLVGQGYVHHSIERGQTVVRMPWEPKLPKKNKPNEDVF